MLKAYIEAFTKAAKAQGIDRLNFYTGSGRSRSLSVYQGELDKLELSEVCRLFIEGEVEGFAGEVYVENFAPEQVEEPLQLLRESALAYRRPFAPRSLTDMPEQEGGEEFLPLDKVLEGMLSAERAAAADSRTALQGCFFQEQYTGVTLADGTGRAMTDRLGEGSFYVSFTRGSWSNWRGRACPCPGASCQIWRP